LKNSTNFTSKDFVGGLAVLILRFSVGSVGSVILILSFLFSFGLVCTVEINTVVLILD